MTEKTLSSKRPSRVFQESSLSSVSASVAMAHATLVAFVSFYLFIYFIYLFLAVLGLCCCALAFSSCGEWGLLFVAVRGLLIATASLVVEHGL